jgi:tetratricopeptide (TPR) repeat protein
MPNNKDDVIDRAEELCLQCDEQEAEKVVRKALEKQPNHLGLKTELAIILSRQGHDDKAQSMLEKVLIADPGNERAVVALGRLLDNSLRTDEAINLFTAFLTNSPRAHMVVEDLCRLWYDSDGQEKAFAAARKQAEVYPADVHAYDAIRYLLERQEDDLQDEMEELDDEGISMTGLFRNFAEQESILQTLQGLDSLSSEKPQFMEDLDEDNARIQGEITELTKRMLKEGIKPPIDN